MLRQGAARLGANRQTINDLNVFPIPDGDTGDNMHMTLCGGSSVADTQSLGETALAASQGMLLGARGNSGVILSRFFAGIAKGLSGLSEADLPTFIQALQEGVRSAYGAVSEPVEGTMLTVLREGVAAAEGEGFEACFQALVRAMEVSLEHTPEQLPVLKEAGVVDSGGAGVLCIAEGMLDALEGRITADNGTEEAPAAAKPQANLDLFGPDAELGFGYCTEFLLRLQTAKVGDPESFDESEIRDWLNQAGESVVCFKDGSIVKVHVHTRTPGDILSHAQRWGEFLTVKIENMTLQHSGATIQNNFSPNAPEAPKESFAQMRKRYAVVAVASGEGLVQAYRDAGVEEVIEGGQTMNPSAADFLAAFDRAGAETLFVFPNNSNILLTAQQAASLYDKAEVFVLPSKDVGAGYVAAASVDRSCKDAKEIAEAARATLESATTCQVSRADRDTVREGIAIRKGEFIGFEGSRILCASPDRNEAARKALEALGAGDHDVALAFYGKETPAAEAEALINALQAACPRTEWILGDGGQPIFDYIITLC
jgi:DAK2 domain fusion protein YloV